MVLGGMCLTGRNAVEKGNEGELEGLGGDGDGPVRSRGDISPRGRASVDRLPLALGRTLLRCSAGARSGEVVAGGG